MILYEVDGNEGHVINYNTHCLPCVHVNTITIPIMTPFHLQVDVLGRELPLSL